MQKSHFVKNGHRQLLQETDDIMLVLMSESCVQVQVCEPY